MITINKILIKDYKNKIKLVGSKINSYFILRRRAHNQRSNKTNSWRNKIARFIDHLGLFIEQTCFLIFAVTFFLIKQIILQLCYFLPTFKTTNKICSFFKRNFTIQYTPNFFNGC
jgi:hypothetical protein